MESLDTDHVGFGHGARTIMRSQRLPARTQICHRLAQNCVAQTGLVSQNPTLLSESAAATVAGPHSFPSSHRSGRVAGGGMNPI